MERSVWGTVTGFEEMVCPFCGYRFRAGKQPQQRQCIMKTRPASEGRSWMWRRPPPPPAAREEIQGGVGGGKGEEGIRQRALGFSRRGVRIERAIQSAIAYWRPRA